MSEQRIVSLSHMPGLMFESYSQMTQKQQDAILEINIALSDAGDIAPSVYQKQFADREMSVLSGEEVKATAVRKSAPVSSLDDWLNNAVSDDALAASPKKTSGLGM